MLIHNKKTLILLTLILFMSPSYCLADDAWVMGNGGNVIMLEGENPSVQMVREWVRMDIYPEHYKVTAQFVFHNIGNKTTLKMGFPENNSLYEKDFKKHSGFSYFKTWIDNKRAETKRVYVGGKEEEMLYKAFWVKTIRFKRGQTRIVRIEYSAQAGYAGEESTKYVGYNFTGGNWYGKLEDAYFVAVLHLPGAYNMWSWTDSLIKRGDHLSARWSNWSGDGDVYFFYEKVDDGAMLLIVDEGVDSGLPYNGFDHLQFINVQPSKNRNETGWFVVIRNNIIYCDYDVLLWILRGYKLLGSDSESGNIESCKRDLIIPAADSEKRVKYELNSSLMVLSNGAKIQMKAPPFVIGKEVVYIPLKPIADLFGFNLKVDMTMRKVFLSKSNQ